MRSRKAIHTDVAPAALGPYSQAMVHADTLYISGQIALDRSSMELIDGDTKAQARLVFDNLEAIANAAGTTLNKALKLNLSLVDLADFSAVNEIMSARLTEPYPARACIQVAALPKNAKIEIEAIVAL